MINRYTVDLLLRVFVDGVGIITCIKYNKAKINTVSFISSFFPENKRFDMKVASTLVFGSWLLASIAATAADTATLFKVKDSFREPKNIAFMVMSGGASHTNWVLAFMEELSAQRGHKTYFITRVNVAVNAKQYTLVF